MEMADDSPKASHSKRNVLIALLAIIGVFFLGLESSPFILNHNASQSHPNVVVTGLAQENHEPTNTATYPTSVSFENETGYVYGARTSSAGNYAITLANGHVYTVTIYYAGGTSFDYGHCNAGTLNLNVQSDSYVFNPFC